MATLIHKPSMLRLQEGDPAPYLAAGWSLCSEAGDAQIDEWRAIHKGREPYHTALKAENLFPAPTARVKKAVKE